MEAYVVALILAFALYVTFEIHKDRRRRGKSGIPFLGHIFDSVSFNVYEENLDECDGGDNSSKSGKKHSKKHRHHKHHKCSKKHKHRKSRQLKLGSTAMELVEENTQKSEKSDHADGKDKKSSKALKKKLQGKDAMDIGKADVVPVLPDPVDINNNASNNSKADKKNPF